MKYELIHQNY